MEPRFNEPLFNEHLGISNNIFLLGKSEGGEIRDTKNLNLSRNIVLFLVFGRCFPLLSEKDFSGETSAMFVYLWLHTRAPSDVVI